MPLIQISPEFLYDLRDKTMREHKRGFTNMFLQVMQLMFNWGIKRGKCQGVDVNPVYKRVDRIKRPRNAPVKNRPWSAGELEIVLNAASRPIRVAIALGAYAGLRESDAIKTTWNCYDGRAIETRQSKTGNPVWIPAHYRLREILDTTPRLSPIIIIGERGKPYSADTFRGLFFALILRLVKAEVIAPGLSFHGLRHTLGTRLAEADCNSETIRSVLGQQTSSMADHYSRNADRRGNASAAISRLEDQDRNRSKSE
jgi:integrase